MMFSLLTSLPGVALRLPPQLHSRPPVVLAPQLMVCPPGTGIKCRDHLQDWTLEISHLSHGLL